MTDRKPKKAVVSRPPATTNRGREDQVISMAIDLAEQQIRDGTVSATVLAHFVKLGSTRERLEQERLAHENLLTSAKIASMEAEKRMDQKYQEALDAMRRYSGTSNDDYDDYEVYD